MIPFANRFHGQKTIRRAMASQRSIRGPYWHIKFSHPKTKQPYRAAVVVSAKVCPLAVDRNKIRRKIYEAVRLNLDERRSEQIVVIVHSNKVLDLDNKRLHTMIAKDLRSIH